MANDLKVNGRDVFLVHCSVLLTGPDGRVLLVQEAKSASRGRWNLPGGHLDHSESLLIAAERELQEETGIVASMTSLLGIYQRPESIRFVYQASSSDSPIAGDEIMAVAWYTPAQIIAMPDAELIAPLMLREIMNHLAERMAYPLDIVRPTPVLAAT